jgi:hypothetical protein
MLTKINSIQIKYKTKMCVKIKIHLFLTLLIMPFQLFKIQFEFNKLLSVKIKF